MFEKIYKAWYSVYTEREPITPTDFKTQNNLKNIFKWQGISDIFFKAFNLKEI